MESTQGLTKPAVSDTDPRDRGCPACGAPGEGSPEVTVDIFGGVSLRRCTNCGSRGLAPTEIESRIQRIGADAAQGLPRLEGRDLVEPPASGLSLGSVPEPGLAAASEIEIRRALASSWRFVSGARSSEYLDRMARCTAGTIDAAPEHCSVHLFDEPGVRRLALPSGRLLLSVEALGAIEDEAELVFVLGHELAHVAAGDAAGRLVVLGLAELARGAGGEEETAWLRAANDLARLGHGSENEHRADLQGVRAVLALGYDPESVIRYLERMRRAVEDDDARVAENTLAHPLPKDRLDRVRKSWGVHVRDAGASRVNRDAFRRAVGRSALVAELEPGAPFDDQESAGAAGWTLLWKDWRLIGTGVAILLLAALFLVLGLMLAR